MPTERRVRVVDEVLQTDARGKQFLRFVIDERLAWNEEGTWNEGALRGCAYPEEGQVFVQQGDQHFPARSALGKREAPAPHACRPAPTAPARLASTTGS